MIKVKNHRKSHKQKHFENPFSYKDKLKIKRESGYVESDCCSEDVSQNYGSIQKDRNLKKSLHKHDVDKCKNISCESRGRKVRRGPTGPTVTNRPMPIELFVY